MKGGKEEGGGNISLAQISVRKKNPRLDMPLRCRVPKGSSRKGKGTLKCLPPVLSCNFANVRDDGRYFLSVRSIRNRIKKKEVFSWHALQGKKKKHTQIGFACFGNRCTTKLKEPKRYPSLMGPLTGRKQRLPGSLALIDWKDRLIRGRKP